MNLKVLNTNLVTIDDMENIQYLDGLTFPNRVYKAYIKSTRGNENTKYNDARKKLIRNLMLSYEAPRKEGLNNKKTYYYGNLILQINIEENSICYIKNNLNVHGNFKMDNEKRKVLNYIMNIEDKR